jgi:hypothetical protein
VTAVAAVTAVGQPAAPGVTAVAAVTAVGQPAAPGVTAPQTVIDNNLYHSMTTSNIESTFLKGSPFRGGGSFKVCRATLSAPQGAERHDRGDSFQLAVHTNAHVYVTVRLYGRLYGVRRM